MMNPEVVSFTIPTESNKIVFVWNISAQKPEEEIYCSLLKVFSQFGALYSLKLLPNAGVCDPGYYAVIKYYCCRDASKAQEACDQKTLFQDTPLKVRVCNKQKGFQYKSLSLNSSKCQDLANHYLGFNGWSKKIIALQNISGLDEAEDEGEVQEKTKLRYLCLLEVGLPGHGIRSRGVGVAEEILVKHKENGKVAAEYVSPNDDTVDCLSEEELQGLIQVNDFTWTSYNPEGEEEEILTEFSFHEDTVNIKD
ncbi:hypothetical protein XENTR_v10010793 [Xenopus tropicalis]|uniref:RAD52 motif-containing protein 1 isoform X2 n=1 Tax=Xenopus tropicalis TaxID=8364 RepID=A0A8J0R286_XENTR|nr:RAD52 motif-containing protein 1 isoform X2 [Xenopus tropicalis]KAE8606591.1 hypothetical protein XENTR_v10010793 [Xenopus tropicalis]